MQQQTDPDIPKQETTAIALFGVFFWIFVGSLVVLAIFGIASWG